MGNEEAPKWIKSDAKAYLYDLLEKEEIPSNMKPKDVFETYCADRPEFIPFGYKNFSSRLRAMRIKVAMRNDCAKRDEAALANDRTIYPRPIQDGYGLPYWPDAAAKELLGEDMNNGKHKTMTGEALWSSRPEYSEVFVKHIHQEVNTRKFHAYVDDKANDRIAKKDLANMPKSK